MANLDVDDADSDTSLFEDEDPKQDFDKDLLTCSICMEHFTQPKTLNCHHTFCLDCLRSFVESQQRGLYAVTRLSCPTCRISSRIPDGGIEAFQNDFRVEKVKAALLYAKTLYKSSSHLCDVCRQNRTFPLATKFCYDCKKHLCQCCFNKHQSISLLKDHFTFKLKIEPDQKLCESHKKQREPVKFWCKECNELACTMCIMGDHADHELMDLEKAVSAKRKMIQDYIAQVDNYVPQFKQHLETLQGKSKMLKTKYEDSYYEIKAKADKIVEQVRNEEEKLLYQIEIAYTKERDFFDEKIKELNDDRKLCNSLKKKLCDIDTNDLCTVMTTELNILEDSIKNIELNLSRFLYGSFFQYMEIPKFTVEMTQMDYYLGTVTMTTGSGEAKPTEKLSPRDKNGTNPDTMPVMPVEISFLLPPRQNDNNMCDNYDNYVQSVSYSEYEVEWPSLPVLKKKAKAKKPKHTRRTVNPFTYMAKDFSLSSETKQN